MYERFLRRVENENYFLAGLTIGIAGALLILG